MNQHVPKHQPGMEMNKHAINLLSWNKHGISMYFYIMVGQYGWLCYQNWS